MSQDCLRVELRTLGDIALIELDGELDLTGITPVQKAVNRAERSARGPVVIDLGRLTFIDASGLRVLIAASAHLNGRLRLLPAHGAARRIFELTGTLDRLPFITSLAGLIQRDTVGACVPNLPPNVPED